MPLWAWLLVALAAGALVGLLAYACLTAGRTVRTAVIIVAAVLAAPTALAAAGEGAYWAIDTTNVLDGIGLNGAWSCDEFDSHAEAQKELDHEVKHHDQGSIKQLDPDGNGKACDGWNHHSA